MLKTYFFFIKHYYFTLSVFLLTRLHLCAEMGAKAKLTKMASLAKIETLVKICYSFGEYSNQMAKGAPWRVAILKKRQIWQKIAKGQTKNKIRLREMPLVKMAKLTKKSPFSDKNGESGENFPRFLRIFKLDGKKGPLSEWRF